LPCSRSFHSCTLAYKLCHSHDMGDTLSFCFFSFSLFFFDFYPPLFPLLLKQLANFTSTQHSLTRTSVQCLGNTQQATLDRIGTQKEEWVSKGNASYTLGDDHGLAAGVGVNGLAWMLRRCRRRAYGVEACNRDENHLKRRTKQQRKLPKRKCGEMLKWDGDSGAFGPDTPGPPETPVYNRRRLRCLAVVRPVRQFGRKSDPKTSNPRENQQN